MIKAKNDQKSNDLFLIIWKKSLKLLTLNESPPRQLVSTF